MVSSSQRKQRENGCLLQLRVHFCHCTRDPNPERTGGFGLQRRSFQSRSIRRERKSLLLVVQVQVQAQVVPAQVVQVVPAQVVQVQGMLALVLGLNQGCSCCTIQFAWSKCAH